VKSFKNPENELTGRLPASKMQGQVFFNIYRGKNQ